MEAQETSGIQGTGQLAATTIYDAVKITFFQHYCNALTIHAQCKERQLKGSDARAEPAFIAAITALYIDAAPKLDQYMTKDECNKLEALLDEKETSFKEAEKLFILLRKFLEKNGVTKYEWKHTTPEEYTLGGMIRK